ncbi:hypothetical protein TWF970_007351 [Orbilia oligospora]|uniref:Uncharacterized protein n=1 Tax=Orbilia oligospora TaxID=2813651 RepID=A0A7C8VEN6_ORBOL|nr:hypothetical protein TWF970_007351 [Orbilia oligospora]
MGLGVTSYYLTSLLKEFHGHRLRFRIPQKVSYQNFRHGSLRERLGARQLDNYRHFFEADFMKLISTDYSYHFSDFNTQSIPPDGVYVFEELFQLLENIVNNKFEAGNDDCFAGLGRLNEFIPLGIYPQLEGIIKLMHQTGGALEFATGTPRSVFVISELETGKKARLAAQNAVKISSNRQLLDDTIPRIKFPVKQGTGSMTNYHDLIDKESQAKNAETQRLCEVVKSALQREEGLLLLFDKALAAFIESPELSDLPAMNPNIYPIRNLKEMIMVDGFFNLPSSKLKGSCLFKHTERRELAAKLALYLLMSCDSEKASAMDSWNGNHVTFFSSSDSQKGCNRESPYISCLLGQAPSTSQSFIPNNYDTPRRYTEIARLLMEIEYGPIFDSDEHFSAKNNFGLETIKESLKMHREYDDPTKSNYLDAIGNCLRFGNLFRYEYRSEAIRSTERPADTCRRIIRTEIVLKLLLDLPAFKKPLPKRARPSNNEQFPISQEKLLDIVDDGDIQILSQHQASSVSNIDHGLINSVVRGRVDGGASFGLSSANSRQDSRSKTLSSRPSMIPRRSQGSKTNQGKKKVSFGEASKKNIGSLFDSQESIEAPATAGSAKLWFQKLNDLVVDPILSVRRRQADRLVKVAVLDTGIDIAHPMITKAMGENGSKITKFQDWTQSPYSISDRVGHGTAVSEILLRVAKVDLYVGKVTDAAEFDDKTPGIVAQAIEYATSSGGWDVDIVVLSLGFESEDNGIRRAILNAHIRNKIIFAAASNSASLVPELRVSFPARMCGQVISIRSASGQSVRSNASPIASDGDDNFMTLGEGIEAAWPSDLNDGNPTRYVSGTSFATPVAAGIAALILEFSVQQGKVKGDSNLEAADRAILWSHRGVRKIFQVMSTIVDRDNKPDCRMVYPWGLFDNKRKYPGHAMEINRWLQNPGDPGSVIGTALPIPGNIDINHTYKESWTMDLGRNSQSKIGYWAKIAQLPVAAGAHTIWGRSKGSVYTIPKMDTYSIEPTPEYVKASTSLASSDSIRKGSNFYMVTGVKIARGGSAMNVDSKDVGANVILGVDVTMASIPIEVGGEVGYSTGGYNNQSFGSSSDFVFAYRVREIFYEKRILKSREYNKGAVLGEGLPSQIWKEGNKAQFTIDEAETGDDDFIAEGEIDVFEDDDGQEVAIVS